MRPAEEEYDHLGVLTERNLVDFARQIAAGMVSLTVPSLLEYTIIIIMLVTNINTGQKS